MNALFLSKNELVDNCANNRVEDKIDTLKMLVKSDQFFRIETDSPQYIICGENLDRLLHPVFDELGNSWFNKMIVTYAVYSDRFVESQDRWLAKQ